VLVGPVAGTGDVLVAEVVATEDELDVVVEEDEDVVEVEGVSVNLLVPRLVLIGG
jgi:hypothetical protein